MQEKRRDIQNFPDVIFKLFRVFVLICFTDSHFLLEFDICIYISWNKFDIFPSVSFSSCCSISIVYQSSKMEWCILSSDSFITANLISRVYCTLLAACLGLKFPYVNIDHLNLQSCLAL